MVSTAAIATATKTAVDADLDGRGGVPAAGGTADDRVRDRAEHGDADRAADRAGEQVAAGDDAALVPPDARLRRDQRRGGDEAHPEPDDEAADGDVAAPTVRREVAASEIGADDRDRPCRSARCCGTRCAGRTARDRLAAIGQPSVSAASARPATSGRDADRALQVGRHVRGEADQDGADAERDQRGRDQQPPREHPQRQDRLGGAPLDEHERRPAARAPTANAPMLHGEFHAHAWPPSSTARMSSVMPPVRSTAPA